MKKHFGKPGFEFIMALSIMAILGLPPLVLANANKYPDRQPLETHYTDVKKDRDMLSQTSEAIRAGFAKGDRRYHELSPSRGN